MKYLSIILIVFIVSCSVPRETVVIKAETTTKKKSVAENTSESIAIPAHNVHIIIREQIPYCGGAYPSDDQLNNSAPYGEEIVLINHKDSTRTIVYPMQNTGYYLPLEPGNYSIQEGYKNVSYHQFRSALYINYSEYIVSGDEDCYKKWWESTLIDFTVTNSDTILTVNAFVSVSCYTGKNPCDYYTGPYPP